MQDDQGCLPHIKLIFLLYSYLVIMGRLFWLSKKGIVRDETFIINHFFNNRMTTVFNIDDSVLLRLGRTYRLWRATSDREAQTSISATILAVLNTDNIISDFIADFAVQLIFQCTELILRTQDFIFQFLKAGSCNVLRRRVSDGARNNQAPGL